MASILFLCTGNTCRSPMAECIFQSLSKQRKHFVRSAGVYATDGDRASMGAQRAMQRRGLSLENHRTRKLTLRMLQEADVVVGMTPAHIQIMQEMFPNMRVSAISLNPPISDPYGGNDNDYERTALQLEERLPALLRAVEAIL